LEHLQHRKVFRKDFRNELLDPGIAGEQREMAHQSRADAVSLVFVNDRKSQLGCSLSDDDIAATADDDASAAFFRDCHQSDVGDEIDVEKKRLLAFGKMPFGAEEAAIERLSAGAVDGREHVFFVIRSQSTYFDLTAVAKPFHRGVFRCFHHDREHQIRPGAVPKPLPIAQVWREREDLDIVQTAILTLLALIIGFSFSMAVSRYDLRKTYEEAEANAIGTEYLRADLLPGESVTAVRDLIRKWLDLRSSWR
jgi:hypothetical protein